MLAPVRWAMSMLPAMGASSSSKATQWYFMPVLADAAAASRALLES